MLTGTGTGSTESSRSYTSSDGSFSVRPIRKLCKKQLPSTWDLNIHKTQKHTQKHVSLALFSLDSNACFSFASFKAPDNVQQKTSGLYHLWSALSLSIRICGMPSTAADSSHGHLKIQQRGGRTYMNMPHQGSGKIFHLFECVCVWQESRAKATECLAFLCAVSSSRYHQHTLHDSMDPPAGPVNYCSAQQSSLNNFSLLFSTSRRVFSVKIWTC